MGEDGGEKTEEPTPHKLREARKKGQIPKSKEITSAIMIVVSFLTLKASARHMWENIIKITYRAVDYVGAPFSASLVGGYLKETLFTFLYVMAPMFCVIMLTAVVVESMQTGFLVSLEAIEPKFSKLNPIEGMKKFFSLKQYVELLKSLIKITVVVWLIFGVLKERFFIVLLAQQLSLWQVMAYTGGLVMDVIMRVGAFYIIIALFDYMYQKFEYIKSMRMSKKEIKDEYKRLEGDPMIKQRQRDAARQMSQSRQMGSVPGADVVVTNPVHIAIALKYDPNEMGAPVVIAKGKRLVAEEIKRAAEEFYIPIVENVPLAQGLFRDSIADGFVPPQYYKAVAEILAFVYNLKKKRRQRY
jgi:flagellar biosynthesis protein FlhB